MADVISIFKGSGLKSATPAEVENCTSQAANNLLSILPRADESELKFSIDDEYARAKGYEGESRTPVVAHLLGSTLRKNLRKLIRQIDPDEILQGAEYLDERGSRRQSEAYASRRRKSSTPLADLPASRRGTRARSSQEYAKAKLGGLAAAQAQPERRDSCYRASRSGSRRLSTKTEDLQKERLQGARGSISNRSCRTDSLVASRIRNGVDDSEGFALSPPSWGCTKNQDSIQKGTWPKKEHTRRKVTSWLAQQLERVAV